MGLRNPAPLLFLMRWIERKDYLFLEGVPGVTVLVTGRSLSMPAGEEPEAEKLRAYVEATGLRPLSVTGMRQVHGARFEEMKGGPDRVIPSCDGLLTGSPGLALVVRTADCLPIVAVGAGGCRLGVAHAGWRGIRAGVADRLVRSMGPGPLEIAIGPGIGPCCYQVGPEFEGWFEGCFSRREGRLFLDLVSAVSGQIERAGVPRGRIHAAPGCTSCLAGRFHSFRREGASAGRMLTVAMIS